MIARYRLRLPVFATAGLLTLQLAHADIITMKSGERYQGPLVTEDASTVTIEYNLTPKIKDKKVLNKADIKEHVRQSAAMIEMEEKGLAKILPTADLLSAAEYEAIIQDRLRTFNAKHPGTPEAAEVEKIIATLGEEKARVQKGEVKMEGRWLDAETAKRDAYNIEAYRRRQQMTKSAAENVDSRYLTALRSFEDLRTQYPASLQYVAAIPEALDILDKYEKQLSGLIVEQPIISKQREDGLKLLSGPEQQLSKSAIDQEKANYKTLADAQVKAKVKWRDTYRYDLKSLQDATATVIKERTDLKAVNLAALQAENEVLTAAIRYIADGNATEAQNTLARIAKGQLLNKVAFAAVEKQVKTAVTEAQKAAAKAKTTAVVAAPEEERDKAKTAEGTTGNPIEEAMKKKQEELAKKKKEADKKKEDAAKPAASAAQAPSAEAPETMTEKLGPYIPIVGGGVLVVLLAVIFLGKKKKVE